MNDSEFILQELLAHDAWIRALARRLVSDEHAADDLVQDAWVEACKRPPRENVPLRSWLGRVLRNLVAMRWRSDTRRRKREREVARPESLPSVAAMREQASVRHRVTMVVFSLEEPYRSAILYRYFKSLSPDAIAARLGISRAAVKGRLRRGLQRLRARLDRDFGDRESWCAALLPLLGPGTAEAVTTGGAATASVLTGALIMSTKAKIGIALLVTVIVALGAAYAVWPRDRGVEPPEVPKAEIAGLPTPRVGRAGEAEPAAPRAGEADARSTRDRPRNGPGEVTPVVVSPELVSLTGTVRTEAGEPIPNACLRIEIDNLADTVARRRLPAPRTARTDAAGRYAFEGLHPELSLWLTVSAAGFGQDSLHVKAGDRQDFALAVGGRITGRVVDEKSGRPLSAAVVWASNDSLRGRTGGCSRNGKADADGRFVIENVRPGVYRLRAESPHHVSDFRRSPHFVVRSRRTTEAVIRLRRGMTLRGQVLDTRGCPIAGARIGDRDPVLTDADGRFSLQGLPGEVLLHIQADGKTPYRNWTRFLQREIAAGSAERTFRLGDAAILRGRVVGPDDHPVAGARIRTSGNRPLIEADEEGRFEVAIESPGRPHRFAVLAEGYASVRLDPITLAAGETRDDLVVRLTRGGGIEGRVVTESGAPIAGQAVLLLTWPSRAMGLASVYRWTTTEADGRFRYEALAAGTYEVSANGKSLPDRNCATKGRRRGIRVEEGKTVTGIVLVPAPRIALRGRTLDERGRPLAGVRVVSWCGPSRAWSDPNGRFVLDGMPEGCPCRFEVSKDDYTLLRSKSSLPETVTAETPELVIRMAPIPPGIRGHVLRADTGAPVPSFWVRLHRVLERTAPDGTPRFRSSMSLEHFQDAEGQFWLTRFRGPGEVALEAGTEDGLVSESPVYARVAAGVPPPVVELRLVAGAVVRGRVLAPDGTPIDRARVLACDPDDGRWLGEGRSFTHPDGIYVIKGIPPGEMELHAKHDDWYAVRTTVRAERGRTVEQDLRLGESGAVLEVAVRDMVGAPVAGARVRLFTPKGEEVFWDQDKYFALYATRFRAQGRTSFGDQDFRHEIEQTSKTGRLERRFLPPGDYVVEVSKDGYRPARRTVSVRLEGKNAVEISLARAR